MTVAPDKVDIVLFDGLGDLPHFNPDVEERGVPSAVQHWRRALAASAAVLIASPEYGHSLPGALKNGIDWVIGSGELYRKVVAITASVGDRSRGRQGLAALAQTLRAVDAQIVWSEPILKGPNSETELRALLGALLKAAAEVEPC